MPRKPPPDEIRLRALGVTRLKPGEVTYAPRVRAKKEVLEAFLALTPEERGAVVEVGLRALSAKKGGDEQ
jgi:nitrate reductase alpha subunit